MRSAKDVIFGLALGCLISVGIGIVGQAEELDYRVTDPDLKVERLDSSVEDSFLAVRTDSTGRIFAGGRRTLFVYDLDDTGQYRPRQLLFEFPDHTWVNDIEVRGDDLYVVTVSAVYRFIDGRIKREGLKPERLLWGVPNGHVHQCFHACVWGPEGDLYVSMGDPLWYYGDFTRPDHWGHWTMFFRPDSNPPTNKSDAIGTRNEPKKWASVPYNGVGGVFRIRPDGSGFQSVARGLRNPCGLCFDRDGNLFTNDNDHEGIPALYAPGRLIHVREGSYWSWPRGWMQSKTPERSDILPMVNDDMGRAVPVLQAYYSDRYLPAKYDNNLMVARWCRRTVSCFPLEATGDTFTAKEHVLLEGREQARPVGVCVGRGGRVFVTICYMAQNEGSPVYRSDLAVITRKDDPGSMPFTRIDVTKLDFTALKAEAKQAAWSRSSVAMQELLRRRELGDPGAKDWQPPTYHRPLDPQLSVPSRREISKLEESASVELKNLEAKAGSATKGTFPDPTTCLKHAEFSQPKLTALRCRSSVPAVRLGGVLTAGFRLTMPAVHDPLPPEAPLAPQQKEEANIILYADEKDPIDLRTLGKVGNFTTAEHWKVLKHTPEQEELFALLFERLEDDAENVRLQAAHFLSLLHDPRSEPKIRTVIANAQDVQLEVGKITPVRPQVWMLGPIPDADGLKTVHPVETKPIDLTENLQVNGKSFGWTRREATSPDRPLYDFRILFGTSPNSSVYSLFRFDSPTAQRMQLLVGSEDGVKVWQNGKPIFEHDVIRPLIQLDDVVPINLQPGSNEILVRVSMKTGTGGQYLHYRQLGNVSFSLPDKPDGLSLAERLKLANTGTTTLDPKFADYDWATEVKMGDVIRGRRLFGAESLGCVKCHAATPTQAGGGAPSLTDAGKRFTVPYLVESVLIPSKVISPVFKASIITTTEGLAHTGLVVSETNDKLELLLPDTKRLSIDKSKIDERKLGDVSAMPAGLAKTPEELRDVIAYLLSNPTE